MNIKKGDKVKVITGAYKGTIGEVKAVFPKEDRVIVEGVNMVKKHLKPTQANPEGGIVEKEAKIHVSNVMLYDEKAKVASRITTKVEVVDGKKVTVGTDTVKGAKVKATVIGHGKSKKILVFKYKAKKNERKMRGHRQPYTKIQIEKITTTADKAKKEDTAEKKEVEKKEVKKWKHLKVSQGVGHIIEPYETIKGRLTLYYENINRLPNFKTTETIKCFRSEIDEILRIKREKDKLKVNKYYFKY